MDGRMLGLSFFSFCPPLRVVATTRWFCYAHIHCRAGKPQISDSRKLTLFRERLSQKRREEFNDAWKSRFCSVWFELEVESENCQKKVRRPRWTWSGHIAIIIFARFVSRAVRTLSPLLTLKRKGLRRLLWPCRFLKDMTSRKSVKNHKFVCSTSSIFALAWAVSTSTAICFCVRSLAWLQFRFCDEKLKSISTLKVSSNEDGVRTYVQQRPSFRKGHVRSKFNSICGP